MKNTILRLAALAALAVPSFASAQAKDGDGGRAQEAADALAMVKKAFEPFPGGLLRSEVLRNEDGSPMVEVGEDGSVKVRVRIAVNPSLYREWTKDVMQKLDAVSTTYEDGTVPCSLSVPASSLAALAASGMGDLPPEYAAMAAQAAQMGGNMGMGYAAPGVVHPLAQMEMENAADSPPLISFRQDELRGPASRKTDELTLRLVRPGQDAVWKRKPGDVDLRARVYKFKGDKAEQIRRYVHDAMKMVSEVEQRNSSGTGRSAGARPSGNGGKGGSLVLSVSILSGKDVLAKKAIRPTNHRSQEGEMVYPLSVSLVSLSGMWGAANDLVVSPFLVMDSSHCYQAWEDWVLVGRLSDDDLEKVTDIRSKVFFR